MRIAVEMISAGSGFTPAAGGMTTYYEALAKHLPATPGVESMVAFVPSTATHAELRGASGFEIVECEGLGQGRVARIAFEHFRLPRLVTHSGADVLLSTHNVTPLRWRGPSAVVVQSFQYFMFPDEIGLARRAYLRAAVPRSLRSADRVIAVSEAARRDAIELFELVPDRVVTVHHGCSAWAAEAGARFRREGAPPVPPPISPDAPYAVMVSSLYAMKNHRRLIEAFAIARREARFPHRLAIAGMDFDVTREDLRGHARQVGVEDCVDLLGAYPQEHLPALLANADAVVYPSLYETFGHPVLEAFAFRRPLLTSRSGGAAEIAGDAAVLVDPRSVESIADGLKRLLTDTDLRRDLIERGAKRLGDFSWERCAEGTAMVLADAIEHHSR